MCAKGRCEQMPLQSGYRYYDLGTYHCDTPLNGVLPYTVTEAAAGRHNPPLNAQKNPCSPSQNSLFALISDLALML